MRRPGILLPTLAAGLFYPGDLAAQAESRDSAGLRLMAYPVPEPAAARRFAAPSVTIQESASCQLNRIRGIVLQQSGNIVVANFGNHELCVFDGSGRFVQRFGRRGSGPGEFQAPSGLWGLSGDSLLTSDVSLRRLSVFTAEGDFVRSFPIKAPVDTLGSLSRVLALRDGSVLMGFSEFVRGAPRPEAVQFHQRLFRFSSEGALLGPAGRAPIAEHFIQAVPQQMGGVAYWNRAFGRQLTVAAVTGGFVAGDGTDFSVVEYDLAGRPRRVHRLPVAARPVTRADIAAYRERQLAGQSDANRAVAERMVAEMPFPASFPAYSRILTDPGDRIWIEEYSTSGAATGAWTVLDPPMGTAWMVSFPPRFTLWSISRRRTCGVARDQDDVESVVCFDLER